MLTTFPNHHHLGLHCVLAWGACLQKNGKTHLLFKVVLRQSCRNATQPKVCVTDYILPNWRLEDRVIKEVGQKLTFYDNDHACPLGDHFP